MPARSPGPVPEGLLVYCILQGFSRREFGNSGRLDLDLHTGLRIAARARRAPADVERSKTDQGPHAAFFHRGLDRGEGGVEGASRGGIRDIGGSGNVIDDFQLVNFGPLGTSVDDAIMLQWTQPASQLGRDRGLSEDQSPAPPRRNGACEVRALLIPRLKSVRESGRDVARPFAIYSNCKSIVSSIHGLHIQIFLQRRETLCRPRCADADAGSSDKLEAATVAAQLAPRCTNLVSDHRGGSLVVGDRWNRRHVGGGLARFRLSLRRVT